MKVHEMPYDDIRWEELQIGDQVIQTFPAGNKATYNVTARGWLARSDVTAEDQAMFDRALALGSQLTVAIDEEKDGTLLGHVVKDVCSGCGCTCGSCDSGAPHDEGCPGPYAPGFRRISE